MQVSMFCGTEPLKINKKIRLIELFAGIGAQAKALENIGADFEHYRICEFDKYAVASYNAIHGTDFGVSDITKWHASDLGIEQKDKYEYIMSYSFPCQSLSVAGKGAGMAKGSGTRSGLLWEVERILEECDGNLPQVLLMENVDAILFEKNRKHFFQWCNKLEELGYKNYYEVLNAKHYGIPQNRNRCFMVSVLGDYYYEFPKPIKLELCVKDLLESEVAEKYYISDKRVKELLSREYNGKSSTLPDGDETLASYSLGTREAVCYGWDAICPSLCSRDYKDPKIVCQPCLTPARLEKRQNGRRLKEDGEPMFTLTGQDIHGVLEGIPIPEATKKGYSVAYEGDTINLENMASKTRRGKVGRQIAQTINTATGLAVVTKEEVNVLGNYNKSNHNASRIISPNGISPAVMENHGTVTAIACELRTDGIVTYKDNTMGALRTINQCGDKYIIEKEKMICYNYTKKDGTQTSLNDRVYDSNNSSPAITTRPFFMPNYLVDKDEQEEIDDDTFSNGEYGYVIDKETGKPIEFGGFRIRKLMPIECYRLMGFTREDFFKVKEAGISDSQCYKQAGNSIVVDVLEAIFRNMNIKGVKRWND